MTITDVPDRPRTGSTVALAEVCHICHRGLLGPTDGTAWTLACGQCRRIDGRLGQEYGLTQCTPLWGGVSRVARPNLHATLLRGLSFERALDTLRWHHTRGTVALASTRGGLDLLQVPGDDVDAARITDWRAWSEAFPVTDDAVAAAYQLYVHAVHPWIDSVEPRVADRSWLASLLAS